MSARTLARLLRGRPTSDGGGVRLTRVITPELGLDPFLLLDEFDSANAGDYIAGFPAHPHRGFETVTYMLDGHLLHEDHLGNRGDLVAGGVQWTTAGRGIIHSQMPQQVEGRMRGFQLWLNLPAAEKMKPAGYRDLAPADIPTLEFPGARACARCARREGRAAVRHGPVRVALMRADQGSSAGCGEDDRSARLVAAPGQRTRTSTRCTVQPPSSSAMVKLAV